MAFSSDYNAISSTLGGWRSSHNPDGVKQGDGTLELAPDLTSRMLAGEITPLQARQEWALREPQQRAFNNELRARAGFGGMVADAEQALDPEGRPAIRDASSGQYVDLSAEARAATGLQETEGITPPERPAAAPGPNQGLRDAYTAMVARRAS